MDAETRRRIEALDAEVRRLRAAQGQPRQIGTRGRRGERLAVANDPLAPWHWNFIVTPESESGFTEVPSEKE